MPQQSVWQTYDPFAPQQPQYDPFQVNLSQFSSFNPPQQPPDNSFRVNPSQFSSLDSQYTTPPPPPQAPRPPAQSSIWNDIWSAAGAVPIPTPMGNFRMGDVDSPQTRAGVREFGSQLGHNALGMAQMWANPIGAAQEQAQHIGMQGLEMIPGFSDPNKIGTFGAGDPSLSFQTRLGMIGAEQLGYDPEGIMRNVTQGNYGKAAAGIAAPTAFNALMGKALHVAPERPNYNVPRPPSGLTNVPLPPNDLFNVPMPPGGRPPVQQPLPGMEGFNPRQQFPGPEYRGSPAQPTQGSLFDMTPPEPYQGALNFDQYRAMNGGQLRNIGDLQNQHPDAFGGILGPEVAEMPKFDKQPTMEDMAPSQPPPPAEPPPPPAAAPPAPPPAAPPAGRPFQSNMWGGLGDTATTIRPNLLDSVDPAQSQRMADQVIADRGGLPPSDSFGRIAIKNPTRDQRILLESDGYIGMGTDKAGRTVFERQPTRPSGNQPRPVGRPKSAAPGEVPDAVIPDDIRGRLIERGVPPEIVDDMTPDAINRVLGDEVVPNPSGTGSGSRGTGSAFEKAMRKQRGLPEEVTPNPQVEALMDKLRESIKKNTDPALQGPPTGLPNLEGVRFIDDRTAVMTHPTKLAQDRLGDLGFKSTKRIVPTEGSVLGGIEFTREASLADTSFVQAKKAGPKGIRSGNLKMNKAGEIEVPVENYTNQLVENFKKQGLERVRDDGTTVYFKRKSLPKDAGVIDWNSRESILKRAQETFDQLFSGDESFDPQAIWDDLKRRLKRDPTEAEMFRATEEHIMKNNEMDRTGETDIPTQPRESNLQAQQELESAREALANARELLNDGLVEDAHNVIDDEAFRLNKKGAANRADELRQVWKKHVNDFFQSEGEYDAGGQFPADKADRRGAFNPDFSSMSMEQLQDLHNKLIDGAERAKKSGEADLHKRAKEMIARIENEMMNRDESSQFDYDPSLADEWEPDTDHPANKQPPIDPAKLQEFRDQLPDKPGKRTVEDVMQELADLNPETDDANMSKGKRLIIEFKRMIYDETDAGQAAKNVQDISMFIDTAIDVHQKGLFEDLYKQAFDKYKQIRAAETGAAQVNRSSLIKSDPMAKNYIENIQRMDKMPTFELTHQLNEAKSLILRSMQEGGLTPKETQRFHQLAEMIKDSKDLPENYKNAFKFDQYKLPDGRIINVDATASKGQAQIDFQMKDGTIAKIKRVFGNFIDDMMSGDDTGSTPITPESIGDMLDSGVLDENSPQNANREKSYARKMWDLIRSNPATGDLSAALKQGSSQWYTHNWRVAFKKMVKAFGNEGAAQAIMDEIKSRPLFKEAWDVNGNRIPSYAEQIGLRLSELDEVRSREELSGSEWSETGEMFGKNNVVQKGYKATAGRFARASNRAYNTMLNSLRADMLDNFIENSHKLFEADEAAGGKRQVKDPYTDLVYGKQMADTINTLTGRGPLKLDFANPLGYDRATGQFSGKTMNAESISRVVSNTLFSPRYFASRVRMLNPSTYMMAPPYLRKQYLKGAVAMAGLWAGSLVLAKFATGATVEDDPRSADWGKARWGSARLDMGQGLQQQLVLLARFLSGFSRSSATNKLTEQGVGFRADTDWDIIERFLTNKAHPGIKYGYDYLKRSERQPFSVGDRTLQLFVPMIAGDMLELAKQDPKMLALAPAIALGAGTQIYDVGQPSNNFIGKGGPLGPGGLLKRYADLPYGIPDKQFTGGRWFGKAPVKRRGL